MECEAGRDRGSEFASKVLVCARMYQVGRATGHRAAGSAELVKWLVPKFSQKKEEKEDKEEQGG